MPRRYRKKQPFKKRVAKAAKFAWKNRSTAVKAFQLAQKVARMVNVEYKWQPVSISAAVNDTGLISAPLYQLGVGDGPLEREGDSVKLMRFSGRGFITQNASAQKTAFRIIIFRGKQENGIVYSPSDILDDVNFSSNLYLSPKSFSNVYRSKILFDKTYHMSNNGNSSITLDYNFKLFGHTKFTQGTTVGSTNTENGGFYMLLISNESTNTPIFNFNGKITFTDN